MRHWWTSSARCSQQASPSWHQTGEAHMEYCLCGQPASHLASQPARSGAAQLSASAATCCRRQRQSCPATPSQACPACQKCDVVPLVPVHAGSTWSLRSCPCRTLQSAPTLCGLPPCTQPRAWTTSQVRAAAGWQAGSTGSSGGLAERAAHAATAVSNSCKC